jgi:hypothetical protein
MPQKNPQLRRLGDESAAKQACCATSLSELPLAYLNIQLGYMLKLGIQIRFKLLRS